MRWVLLIHLVAPQENVNYEPVPFETRAECVAAGEAHVEKYPAFEWLDRSGERAQIEPLVVRSTVECVSAKEYKRRKYGDEVGKPK